MKPKLKITYEMANRLIKKTLDEKAIPKKVTYEINILEVAPQGKTLNDLIELEEEGKINKTRTGTPVEALKYLLNSQRYFFELFSPLSRSEIFKTTWRQKYEKLVELQKPLKKVSRFLAPGGKYDDVIFFAFQGEERGAGGTEFMKEVKAVINLENKLAEILRKFPKDKVTPRASRHGGRKQLGDKVKSLFRTYETVFARKPSIGDTPTGPTFRFIKETLESVFPEIDYKDDETLKNVIRYQLKKENP